MNNTSIAGMKRTHMCGDLRLEHAGQTVTVNGWVDRVRDNGGVLFLLLRDRAGIVQCTFDKSVNADLFDIAFTCRTEFVVAVKGKLVARDAAAINKKMPTGEVEIVAEDLRILSKAETTPFEIDDTKEVGNQDPSEVPLSRPAPSVHAAEPDAAPPRHAGCPQLLRRARFPRD